MTITSGYWQDYQEDGFTVTWCDKHQCPLDGGRCSKCLAEKDESIQVFLSEMDRNALDWQPELAVRDLLPANHADWLVDRVLS